MAYTELESFYREDAYCGFGDSGNESRYDEYCNYVLNHCVGMVYEIGSGAGHAAISLKRNGVDVVATDIFPNNARKTFEQVGLVIDVKELNINKMFFPDSTVDNFCMYQVMEHIETPKTALSEIFRCLKSGGKVVIVGPNLISPLMSLKTIVMGVTRKWKVPLFKRTDGYSFPFGDTLVSVSFVFVKNTFLTFLKLLIPNFRKFLFRKPCLKKPAISDSDAALFLNPLDLSSEMRAIGFDIVDIQSPRKTGIFSGSTWIVGIKK